MNEVYEFLKKARTYYLATMQSGDNPETRKRIERHRMMRNEKGFLTIEKSYDIQDSLDQMEQEASVLLEDLSNLLANEIFF